MWRKCYLILTVILAFIFVMAMINAFSSTAKAFGDEIGTEGSIFMEKDIAESPSIAPESISTDLISERKNPAEIPLSPNSQGMLDNFGLVNPGSMSAEELQVYQERMDRANYARRYSDQVELEKTTFHNQSPIVSNLPMVNSLDSRPAVNQESSIESLPAAALYSTTLEILHRNSSDIGHSSTFVFTNTGISSGNYVIDYYWLNGQYLTSDGPYVLAPGVAQTIHLDNAPFGENFVGWVEISGDQTVSGAIQTPDYGIITGRVFEDDGTTVYTDGSVNVNDYYNHEWAGGIYPLNDGRYYIGGLPDGDYHALVSPQEPWAQQWYNISSNVNGAIMLSISGANTIDSVNFILQPGGTITGTVYAADGVTPLENINVDLEQGWFGTCSDANGHYTLRNIPYGDHIIVAGRDWNWCLDQQSVYIQEYYDETYQYDSATPVPVGEGSSLVTGIDFTMEPGGIIQGRVTSAETGDPLQDVFVEVEEFYDRNFGKGAHTDSDGYYTIPGLPDNDYVVAIWNPVQTPLGYGGEIYNNKPSFEEADLQQISGGNTINSIDFQLEPGGWITGVVTDQNTGLPLENIKVEAHFVDGGFGMGVCTNSQGEYRIQGMPFGGWRLSAARGWNWCTNQESTYAQEWYEDVPFSNDATVLNLDGGTPNYADINFTLEQGGTITGTVRDASQGGAPVADLWVIAQRAGSDPWDSDWVAEVQTDPDGHYTLGPLPTMDYLVYACTDCSDILLVNQYYNGAYDFWDAERIAVSSGAVVGGIDIDLTPGIWITGHVTVPEGYSAQDINVDVWKWDGINYNANRRTDANGDYIVPVPPVYDSYWAVGIRPWGTDLGFEWAHGFDLEQQSQWDFDLKPGGVITGWITVDGIPSGDINVWTESGWNSMDAWTDDQGYYEITNLHAGQYRIAAGGDWQGYMQTYYGGFNWNWATPIELATAETIPNINIDVSPLGVVEGYVYESDGETPIEGLRVTAMNSDGFWHAWSQVDGYFHLDVPAGDHRLWFRMEGNLDYFPSYYPGVTKWSDAMTVTVGTSEPLFVTMNMDRKATLSGQVTDASTYLPLPGIHVTTLNIDPANDRASVRYTCTDENGVYVLDPVVGGETMVMAIGTCGNYDYGLVTTTLTVLPGSDNNVDLEIEPGTGLEHRFTVRTEATNDFTPLTSQYFWDPTSQVLPALFTPLAQLDDQGTWYSDLLEQVPAVDNGGAAVIDGQLYVTYTLKTGLLWSDGEPLTSGDIRFAWEMLAQPDPREVNSKYWDAKQIETVLTPDAQTAVLVFKPEYFPVDYLEIITYPLPQHVLAGEHRTDLEYRSDYAHNPVGNGPYVVEDWVPGSHLDLRANLNYHKRSEGFPVIDEMRFLFTDDPFWPLANGQAEASVNINYESLPPDITSWDLQYDVGTNGSYDNIYLNPDSVFFSDSLVRQAMSLALDRETFVANRGYERVMAETWLWPDSPLHTNSYTPFVFDLVAAADLLDAAGWIDTNGNGVRDKDGVEFEFDLAFHENHEARLALVTMFQGDLETIGVNANLIPTGNAYNQGRRGLCDAFTLGWINDSRRTLPSVYDYFHSTNIPTAYNTYEGYNLSRWDNPASDALGEAIRTELDLAARRDLIGQQLALYNDEIPALTHSHWARHNAAVPTLLNFKPQGMTPSTWNIETWELPENPYDLSVRKALALDSPAPQPGVTITYEINVRNAGFFTVTGATLVDQLPEGITFVGAVPPEDQFNGTILTWNLGAIPPNSPAQTIQVSVEIPGGTPHGTLLENTISVSLDQVDTNPHNNGFVHIAEVRDDVDLAISKSGVGQPAIGEHFRYYLDYANWGGAPATSVVITDTLPAEVSFLSSDPPYTSVDGDTLTWTLPQLAGNQWGGQIEIVVDMVSSGTVTNTAAIQGFDPDIDESNNQDDHVDEVQEILAPVILRPTQGTTDLTPTVSGLAPSNATVDLYETSDPETPLYITTTIATASGTFSVHLNLDSVGTYIIRAKASKSGLTSDWSDSATFDVANNLALDPDYVFITADGVDFSTGSIRVRKYTLANHLLEIQARIPCASPNNIRLEVTENDLFPYKVPATSLTNLGDDQWDATFRFWMADPHNNYDVWMRWGCGGTTYSANLIFVLIDPDGYLYDQSLVDAGSTLIDSILVNGVITAYVRTGDGWEIWPAYVYGQDNPQTTDGTTDDGVLVPGYYSFLTPPGQYYLEATVPGYQPYQSEIISVIDEPIHLDIGLQPITGGTGFNQKPLDLSNSIKRVDKGNAWVGDELTYEIALQNSGDEDTGILTLSDEIPDWTSYVEESLNWNIGEASYISGTNSIAWTGIVPGGEIVYIGFKVSVDGTPGEPFDVVNMVEVTSGDTNLTTLPDLFAETTILNQVGVELAADSAQNGDPGEMVVYQHTLTNTGNQDDTFGFEALSSQGWEVTTPGPVTLGPGLSTTVPVTVTIPAGTLAGVQDATTFTARSQTASSYTAEVTDTTTVDQKVAFTLTEAEPQVVFPGSVVTYTHMLTNDGNLADTYTITVSSDQDWVVTVDPLEVSLPVGESAVLEVRLEVPTDASHEQTDQTTLTVESQANPAVEDSVIDMTTVVDIRIYLPLVVK